MERLVVRHLVDAGSVVTLLSNQLAVVAPSDRPLPAPPPGGLADPRVAGLHWATRPPCRPASTRDSGWSASTCGRTWRRRSCPLPVCARRWPPSKPATPMPPSIYRTDAVGRARVRVEYLVPLDQGPRDLLSRRHRHRQPVRPVKARALLSWLRGDTATGIFKAAGFGVPARPRPGERRAPRRHRADRVGRAGGDAGDAAARASPWPGGWLAPGRRCARVVETLVALPLVLPPVATGYLLLRLLGRRGPLGAWLDRIGIEVIFTWKAVLIAMVVMGLPLLVRTARAGFEQGTRRYEQIAETLGAGPWRVFVTISLPLAGRAVLAGALAGVLARARRVRRDHRRRRQHSGRDPNAGGGDVRLPRNRPRRRRDDAVAGLAGNRAGGRVGRPTA